MTDQDIRSQLHALPIFQATSPERIRDVREGLPKNKQMKEHPCQNYQHLFEVIASLLTWPGLILPPVIPSCFESWHKDLDQLDQYYRLFRESRLLRDGFMRRPRDKSVTAAFKIVHETIGAVASLMPFPQASLREDLLRKLYQTFKEHGPSRYPKDAIYAAMALILNEFNILSKRGRPFTSAAIQQDLYRST